jgi:hypothetical protein
MPGFNDAFEISKLAIILLHGWSYNYRIEKHFRADAVLIRDKVGFLLGTARKNVEKAEADYRREFLPPPSREKPRHDPAFVAGAQSIERLSKGIGALATLLNTQPLPEKERMTRRPGQEGPTLQQLIDSDQLLVGQADLLRVIVDGKKGGWLVENKSTVEDGLAAIGETLRKRQGLLSPT